MKPKPFTLHRGWLITAGVTFITLSCIVLGLSLWEAFGGFGRLLQIEVPGFHELTLRHPGVYAGVYQHRGATPIPTKELSQLDVRILSKRDYQNVQVLMNSAGQSFDRFGLKGMPLFYFVIQNPGEYTLSAIYPENNGPTVNILLFPQSVQNIKQTLIVGIGFFVFFLSLGIFILVRLKRWAPLPDVPSSAVKAASPTKDKKDIPKRTPK